MTEVAIRMRACVAMATAFAAFCAYADVPITAVPPASFRGMSSDKTVVPKMTLAPTAPALRIALPEPTAAERDVLRQRNRASRPARAGRATTLKGPIAVAFPRDVPAAARNVALASLPWQTLANGVRAAQLSVTSPGAAALRVALRLTGATGSVSLRFAGTGERAQAFGPVAASAVAYDTAHFGSFWSPVLEGDVATIEFEVAAGTGIPVATLSIARVSHQVVAPSSLRKLDAKTVQDIGTAGSCNIDVACVTPQSAAFGDAAKAVAEMEFTQDDGFTHLCSGTLLNDSLSSNTPYFFSAAHCLDTATAARTLNTYWFFDAISCGNNTVPPYVQQTSGATMLARSGDWDWALVRLNAPPPAGARFSAWRAEPIPALSTATVFHHPQADLKKFAQGSTQGYQVYTDGSSYSIVQYDQGTTEPGSSGAGLLTFLQSGGYYELRGGLWTGEASCENRAGRDEYSRIDNMLPLTREYLTPNTPGTAGQRVAVEYYNRSLDHYFITISAREIDDLDTGVQVGWERTGLRFLAYEVPAPGTSPVCRFYRTPGFGNSHFYSASPSECRAVIDNPQTYPGWTYESGSVFYIALPDTQTGACAGGTQPLWRFYNQRTVNHRYTADQMIRDDMRANPGTWTPEGYGPDSVIMCAPVGT
jgi:hypothetical protein